MPDWRAPNRNNQLSIDDPVIMATRFQRDKAERGAVPTEERETARDRALPASPDPPPYTHSSRRPPDTSCVRHKRRLRRLEITIAAIPIPARAKETGSGTGVAPNIAVAL